MATFIIRSIDKESHETLFQFMTSNTDEVTSLLSTLNRQYLYLYSDNCVICLNEFYFWGSEIFQDLYEFERRNNIKKITIHRVYIFEQKHTVYCNDVVWESETSVYLTKALSLKKN
jgi:hypothetical protein